MPASLYDYCRPPGGNPVSFNTRLVLESSRQLQHPLLCLACEEILNRGGEQWMLPLFARLGGSFPFHDLLVQIPPALVDGDAQLFATAHNPAIQVDKLMRFAFGIFWKAAVHSWRGGETEPLIILGAEAEGIRKYLRGETGLPTNAFLTVGILPKPVEHISFTLPYQGSSTNQNNFLFYALGMEFTLLTGNLTQEEGQASCSGNLLRPVLMVNFAPMVQDIAVQVMKQAHRAKNVQKYLTKPKPQS